MDVEGWFPQYNLLAQAVLTSKQQHEGIPNMEALENSCSDVAEQYISDVLHESKYESKEALRMICMKDIPRKFNDKWKPEEMVSTIHLTLYRKTNILVFNSANSLKRNSLLQYKIISSTPL
jgi:NADPH-dependent curcumin reductase CurA